MHSSCSSWLAPSEGWARGPGSSRAHCLGGTPDINQDEALGPSAKGLKAGKLLGSQRSGDSSEWQVHSGLMVQMEAWVQVRDVNCAASHSPWDLCSSSPSGSDSSFVWTDTVEHLPPWLAEQVFKWWLLHALLWGKEPRVLFSFLFVFSFLVCCFYVLLEPGESWSQKDLCSSPVLSTLAVPGQILASHLIMAPLPWLGRRVHADTWNG